MMMENNLPASNGSPENGGASPLRSWLAVGSVTIGAFAFVTTEFLPSACCRKLHATSA